MGLLERLEKQKTATAEGIGDSEGSEIVRTQDEYSDLKRKVHADLIEILNKEEGDGLVLKKGRDEYIKLKIEGLVNGTGITVTRAEKNRIVREILNDVIGLGPIEPLLANPDVTEIMVNGPYSVYVERRGKVELSDAQFTDNEHVMNVINRIVSSVGRR
ncbi:MAG: Flp pilus assembly complex ATPase component TadA, partial [Ruminococcaceae bacterium]|nr:Flp pilus assembly complex ATPase component TadA [Oscillospiraceae bacterium]